jgi:hypothetical protein
LRLGWESRIVKPWLAFGAYTLTTCCVTVYSR